MKIISATPSSFEYIDTDSDEYPHYRRYSNGEWENLMGEIWEPVYYPEDLETMYQSFISEVAV